MDEKLDQLANSEFQKIQSDKKYRSDFATLKQFTRSNVSVNFSGNQKPINPSEISKYISQQIVKQFNGDREAAEKWCNAKLKKELGINSSLKNAGIKKLNLFYGLCLKTDKLSPKEKTKLKDFILEKGEDEFAYIKLCSEINFHFTF